MKLANLAAGCCRGQAGDGLRQRAGTENALSRKETPEDGWVQKRKIITADEAEALIRDLKKQGKTSGFTNGCFDCLHLGASGIPLCRPKRNATCCLSGLMPMSLFGV